MAYTQYPGHICKLLGCFFPLLNTKEDIWNKDCW